MKRRLESCTSSRIISARTEHVLLLSQAHESQHPAPHSIRNGNFGRANEDEEGKVLFVFEFIQTLFFLLAVTSRSDEDSLMNEYDFCGSSLMHWRMFRRIGVRDRVIFFYETVRRAEIVAKF